MSALVVPTWPCISQGLAGHSPGPPPAEPTTDRIVSSRIRSPDPPRPLALGINPLHDKHRCPFLVAPSSRAFDSSSMHVRTCHPPCRPSGPFLSYWGKSDGTEIKVWSLCRPGRQAVSGAIGCAGPGQADDTLLPLVDPPAPDYYRTSLILPSLKQLLKTKRIRDQTALTAFAPAEAKTLTFNLDAILAFPCSKGMNRAWAYTSKTSRYPCNTYLHSCTSRNQLHPPAPGPINGTRIGLGYGPAMDWY